MDRGADCRSGGKALRLSRFAQLSDPWPKSWHAPWEGLASILTRHEARAERDGPVWSPASFRGRRSSANVAEVACLVLDLDNGDDPHEVRWPGVAHVLHTTWRHAADAPRWRAVFPLAQPVPGAVWPRVYPALLERLGAPGADPACKDAGRVYFLPACPPEGLDACFAEVRPGEWLVPPDPAPTPPQPPAVIALGATCRNTAHLPVDLLAVAAGRVADGAKHRELVRAMLRMRLAGASREACHALVRMAIQNVGQARLKEPTDRALARYARYVEQTYERFAPGVRR